MPFLKSLFATHPTKPKVPSIETKLVGPRVTLRAATPMDWKNWHVVREQSRAFLVPWEPTWPLDGLTYDYFCRNLRRHWNEWREGSAFSFLLCATDDLPDQTGGLVAAGAVLGGLALTEVQRGIAQKGTLGYWIGESYADQGFMTEAVQLVVHFAFHDLGLNRLEAACLPHNEPSKRLLTKIGFTMEGRARRYLRINGRWEDHLLWGKTSED
jgi:ribosomal-protein-alanine N-acetyltransferase